MIDLDSISGTPPYEQIRSQVAAHVETGALQAGDRLPTVRRLAEDLETRGRAGSFVTGDQVTRKAKAAAVAYLAETKALGLSAAEATALVRNLEEHPLHG